MNHLSKLMIFLGICCVLSLQFGAHAKAELKPFSIKEGTQIQVEAHWVVDEESWLNVSKHSLQHAAFLLDIKPAHAITEHSKESFAVFLPDSGETAVGEVWALDANAMLPFLRQFHPGATVALSGKRGAFACLRALSPDYAEIIFQFHADFDLATVEEEAQYDEVLESIQADLRAEKLEAIEQLEKKTSARLQSKEAPSELSEVIDKLLELSDMLTQLDKQLTTLEENLDNKFTALHVRLKEALDRQETVLENVLTAHTQKLTARLGHLTAAYFTPSHFTGRLLINHKDGQVAAFSLTVPKGDGNAMLSTLGRSVPVSVSRMELIRKKDSISSDAIKWTTAISVEEAQTMLVLKHPKKDAARVKLRKPTVRTR